MHLKRDWRSVVFAGVLVLASVTYSQSDLPTPAPPSPNPPLERPIFVPSPPQAPRDTSPTIGPDGKVVAPKIEESRAQTRPDTSISTAPAEGFTTGGDAEPVGKVGDPLVLPFGTKGERVAIAFYSGDFVPPSNERIQPALRALAAQRVGDFNPASGASRPTVDAFILFNGRLPEGLKQQMEEAGIQFFRFYPYSAYQARIPVDLLDRLEATEMVRWVGLPNPVQKTAIEAIAYINQNTTEREWFYITGYGPDANGLLRQQLQMAGVEVVSYHADLELYTIRANSFQLSQVVSIPEAMFIEWVGRPRALHTESMASHNADRLWGGDYDGRPVSGRSIKLGVADSGMNTNHQDFSNLAGGMFGYNRTSEQNWWNDLNAHGTHVSGTFFGQGNAQFRYRGFASGFREHSSLVYDLLHSKVFRQDNFAEGNSMLEGMIDMRGRGNEDVKRRIYNLSGGGDSSLPG
ncbi:MAG: S8 family serine peptidase, partial [Fimbriimonadales bacterium]